MMLRGVHRLRTPPGMASPRVSSCKRLSSNHRETVLGGEGGLFSGCCRVPGSGDWAPTGALRGGWLRSGFGALCPRRHALCLATLGTHQRQPRDTFTDPCNQGTAQPAPFECASETLLKQQWLRDPRNQIAMPRFFFPERQSGITPGTGKSDPGKYVGNGACILHPLGWRWLVFPTEGC